MAEKSRSQSFSDIDQDNKSSRSSSPRSNNSSGGESKKASKRVKQPPQEGESAENSVKLLSAYVSKFGDNFCDGTRLLSLNTHSLRYINARLREHLRKKKETLISFDWLWNLVDSSGLTSADFDTLYNFFTILPRIMIQGSQDSTELDLTFFSALKELEIRNCTVVPSAIRGGDKVTRICCIEATIEPDHFMALTELRVVNAPKFSWKALSKVVPLIRVLVCQNKSTASLSDVLVTKDKLQWESLTRLDCIKNGLVRIDADCLQLATSLQHLNLSHNSIIRVCNLDPCVHLTILDLSHNCIESMEGTAKMLPNLRILNLARNNLTGTRGLEQFPSLEILDLAFNSIKEWKDVKRLRDIMALESLFLIGNKALMNAVQYREYACGFFSNKSKFALDGKPATKAELLSHMHIKSLTPAPSQFKYEVDWSEAIIAEGAVKKKKKKKKNNKRTVENIPIVKLNEEVSPSPSNTPVQSNVPVMKESDLEEDTADYFNKLAQNYSDADEKPKGGKQKIPNDKNQGAKWIQKHLEAMKKDAGDQWLLVLNEFMDVPENKHATAQQQMQLHPATKLSSSNSDSSDKDAIKNATNTKTPASVTPEQQSLEEKAFLEKAKERNKRRLVVRGNTKPDDQEDDDVKKMKAAETGEKPKTRNRNMRSILVPNSKKPDTTATVETSPTDDQKKRLSVELPRRIISTSPSNNASEPKVVNKSRRKNVVSVSLNEILQAQNNLEQQSADKPPQSQLSRLVDAIIDSEAKQEAKIDNTAEVNALIDQEEQTEPAPVTAVANESAQIPAVNIAEVEKAAVDAIIEESPRDSEILNQILTDVVVQPKQPSNVPPTPTKEQDDAIDVLLQEQTEDADSDVDVDDILNTKEEDLPLYQPSTQGEFQPSAIKVDQSGFTAINNYEDGPLSLDFIAYMEKQLFTSALKLVEYSTKNATEVMTGYIKLEEYKADTFEYEKFLYMYENAKPKDNSAWELRHIFQFKIGKYKNEEERNQEYVKQFAPIEKNLDVGTIAKLFPVAERPASFSIIIGTKDADAREQLKGRIITLLQQWADKWPLFVVNKRHFAKDLMALPKDVKKSAAIAETNVYLSSIQEGFHSKMLARTRSQAQSIAKPVTRARSTNISGSFVQRGSVPQSLANTAPKTIESSSYIDNNIAIAKMLEETTGKQITIEEPSFRLSYPKIESMMNIPLYHDIMRVNTPQKYADEQRKYVDLAVTGNHWQLKCQLQVFKESDNAELVSRVIYSNMVIVTEASALDLKKKEQSCILIFSNFMFYILLDNNSKTASSLDLVTIANQNYASLKAIHASYNFQYLKLEFKDTSSYILLPRDELAGKRIVQYFIECKSKFEFKVHDQLFVDAWKQLTASLSTEASLLDEIIEADDSDTQTHALSDIKGAFAVFAIDQSAAVQLTTVYPAQVVGAIAPKTLIVTHKSLFLCDESYSTWPSSLTVKDYITVSSKGLMLDLAHVQKKADNDCVLNFAFLHEKDNTSSTWNIVCSHVASRNAIIECVSQPWAQQFGHDLEVKEIPSSNPAPIIPTNTTTTPNSTPNPSTPVLSISTSTRERRRATAMFDKK